MKVFNRAFRQQCAIFFAFVIVSCGSLVAVITNNCVDSIPVFTCKGSAISLLPKKVGTDAPAFSFSVSPYTQIIRSCYDMAGTEHSRLGDRLGPWGFGAMAANLISNYNPNRNPDSYTLPAAYGVPSDFAYFWAKVSNNAGALSLNYSGTDAPARINFSQQSDLYYSADFDYEKIGIRFEAASEVASGLVCSVQTGVVDHKVGVPSYWKVGTSGPFLENLSAQSSDPISADFMWNDPREIILGQLGMEDDGYQNIEFDDLIAQVSFSKPVPFGAEIDPIAQLIPRLTVGLIIPTNEIFESKKSTTAKDNILKPLVPIGNEGFTGLMVEGGLTLDFQDTVNVSVACGCTMFHERSIANYRLPNNQYQSVFYPFTQNVMKKRGSTWHLAFSMYAEDFIPGMQCFAEYTWVVHRQDCVKLDVAANLPFYQFGLPVIARLSEFRVGTGHLGLSYKMTKNLEAGLGLQVVLHGEQVYKPYTFMGSLFIVF